MAIKNKDGTVYKISKPNPVLNNQSIWSKNEQIYMHNKFGQRYHKEKMPDDEIEMPILKQIKLPNIEKEEISIIQTTEEPQPEKINYPSEDIFDVWCLPCISYEEIDDPLYDEKHGKIIYGEKFLFKAKILTFEDLYIQILTSKKINPKSILYPKTKDRRWWKVSDIKETEEKGFYFLTAIISDYQPSFSV